ncbi:MAG: cob(I)yrinic acid a,c-diamide adenosyltransferase [Candidatus Aenigmatarchaeota archaeon]
MGYIYLYTGTGAGKTTNALGLALRAVGHRQKVIIIQFLKWWKNIGEYRIRNMLKRYYKIYQFGRPGWLKVDGKHEVKYRGMKFKVRSVEELDKELAKRALKFAEKKMIEEKPHLLVLDEINLAVYLGLLKVEEVLELLEKVPKRTQVVLTGRYAPKELIDRADFVNEIIEVKSPKELVTTKGIQY